MSRLRTHYDNLKVARNAPLEIIDAAYSALMKKYAPKINSSNDVSRIVSIINAAHRILSDPTSRREHDEWIRKMENAPSVVDATFDSSPKKANVSTSAQTFTKYFVRVVPAVDGYRLMIVAALAVFIIGILYIKSTPTSVTKYELPRAVNQTQPATPTSVESFLSLPHVANIVPSSTVLPGMYIRPPAAPNGEQWPRTSGYVAGYRKLRTKGLSEVVIDNSGSQSDAYVKLAFIDKSNRKAVRHVLVKGSERFSIDGLQEGTYLILYQDMNSGEKYESPSFELERTELTDSIHYNNYEITLFTVPSGNVKMESISQKAFDEVDE